MGKRRSAPAPLPVCRFCRRSGAGVTFAMFAPRFAPFGTACTDCEATLPPGTTVPPAELEEAPPAAETRRTKEDRARAAVARAFTADEAAAERAFRAATGADVIVWDHLDGAALDALTAALEPITRSAEHA